MAARAKIRTQMYVSPVQQWGFKVRRLREALPGRLSRTGFLYRYHRLLEEFDYKVFSKYEIPDHWLARAERGESVKAKQVHVELLCQAGNATEDQRWEIMLDAGFDPLIDIHGKMTPEGVFCNRVTKLITRSKRARVLVQRAQAGEDLTSPKFLQLLQQIINLELDENEKGSEGAIPLDPKFT